MSTVNGNMNMGGVPKLQDLLDAVPADRMVSCLPTHDSLILHDGEKELGHIPLDGVLDVFLLDDSKIQKKYSIGLSLILGPLVLLFPKKTIREAFRLCIQWKDPKGEYQFTYIHITGRIRAEHMLNAIRRSLTPEARAELAQKVPKVKERTSFSEQEQRKHLAELSPFITCGHCTMEFMKTDLPLGGKCPVCGKPLNVDGS